jgi:D-alanyl-D-alanine carboxypeptidase
VLDGLIGCKTGITNSAGPCFTGYFEKDGLNLVIVLLNSDSME